MKMLTREELIPSEEYERQRDAYRQTVIALKRRRRITIGDKVTLVFENRETLRFQIQEMIRVERIMDPKKIQEELDVYNALIPNSGELSATLLIELTDADRMKEWLDLFMGLDHGQTVGLRAGADMVYGKFEGGAQPRDENQRRPFCAVSSDVSHGSGVRRSVCEGGSDGSP